MDNANNNKWSSKLLDKLGIKQAVFETKKSNPLSQLAMATALSMCMGAGAAMASEHQAGFDGQPQAPITAESLTQMVMDAQKAEAETSNDKPELESTSDAIEGSALGALGFKKNQSTAEKAAAVGGTLLDLASNPQKALIESGGRLLAGSVVGGVTESSETGIFAAGLVGTAIAVGSGGIMAIPAAYGGYKDISDRMERNAEVKLQAKLGEVNERTTRVGLETKFSIQLEEREKRMGASEKDRQWDNDRMFEQASEGHKLGFMPMFVQDRIKLEEMVKQAGGETEPWYDRFEQFKTEFNAEQQLSSPDSSDFLGKAKQIQSDNISLASNSGFLKNLSMEKAKESSLRLG